MSKTVEQLLSESLGGTWKYNGRDTWNCSDGRYVSKCAASVFGYEWEEDKYILQYWLHGDGKPKRAEPYMGKDPLGLFKK